MEASPIWSLGQKVWGKLSRGWRHPLRLHATRSQDRAASASWLRVDKSHYEYYAVDVVLEMQERTPV